MRTTTIGTVAFLVDDAVTTCEANVDRAVSYVREAVHCGCDLVVLPEMFRTINTGGGEVQGERYPGPTLERLSHEARSGSINIAATYYVEIQGRLYNQSAVIDRRGEVAGIYRKVQPTALEARRVTAGSEFAVIDLDFGRIGIMICLEIYFPEIARIYAYKGVDLLLWPTVTLGPTQEGLLAQVQSRAIDNGVYVVESNMASPEPYAPYSGHIRPGTARIVAPSGDVVASTGRHHGLAVARLDLDAVRLTSQCVLIREPDRFREDLASIARLDLYAREYQLLAQSQGRHQPYWDNIPE